MAKKSNAITNEPVKTFPEKISQRLTQIRFRIEELKTDGLFVNYLPNIRYLTNFSGSSASRQPRLL